MNPGPLEKQVLLTAEFSLQPLFLVCLFVLLVFLFSFIFYLMHIGVLPAYEGVIPWIELTDNYDLQYGCWELNLGPLE